ncbi:hypothetical protein BCU68_02600 [Vibrio sp. 10N.286.49.B3]|uniref:SPOR domain-containing protein n=1 Tax=Vibrio sp. 10N.286.49.B3 TaxID=1880855 RepID=UPI000C8344B0|nr:AAA family ATPase [Vibrio sp. 10N.286.49.B3]PMH46286.1 hypothetical protein BCU68_02600 [Vibrio sp. 10N.286.49.B3]
MSLNYGPRELELGTQNELLERLQLLTQFNSNFITIHGQQGAGKSWLAQRYLEVWVEDKNQALLLCHPNQNEEQHRSTLLSQIFSSPDSNAFDALVDSFLYFLDREECDIAIVIDDGHCLSDALIAELWMLILEAQQQPHWVINVILFDQTDSPDKQHQHNILKQLSHGQDAQPIELDITPLSDREVMHFFDTLVARHISDEMDAQTRRALLSTPPLPGRLMELVDLKMEKRIIIRSFVGSPAKIGVSAVLLLLIIGLGYWWLFSRTSPVPIYDEITLAPQEQTVIPTLAIPDQKQEQETDPSVLVDDSSALPPSVVSDTVTVKESVQQSTERVVISSDQVDALLGEPLINPSDETPVEQVIIDAGAGAGAGAGADVGIDVEQAVESLTPVQDDTVVERMDESVPIVESMPADEVVQSGEAVSIKPKLAHEALLAVDTNRYTLQIAALTSMSDVESFIEKYSLQSQARTYRTLRNSREWFIVTLQDFSSIQQARDEISRLPEGLQSLGPWAKSINQVHREIEDAN